jgi:hypothetical protein
VLELACALKPDGRVLFVDDAYRRLADAGWSCRVTAVSAPFFWGEGRPTVSIQNVQFFAHRTRRIAQETRGSI